MSTPTLKCVLNGNNPITGVSAANLNNLSSGSKVLAAAISNVPGDSSGEGYPRVTVKFHAPSMTVSTGGYVQIWFLRASDGSVYEQGGASVTPARPPDVIMPVVAQTAAVDVEFGPVQMPICGTIKCLLDNELGAAIDSGSTSASYLKIYYDTDEFPSI